MLIVAAWTATSVVAIIQAAHGFAGASDWYVCVARVIGVGLLPGVLLVVMLRRAAPLRPRWTGALAAAAAMAAGAFAIQLVCPVDDAGHALLGHLGPVLAFGLTGALAGRRVVTHDR
jgi:hypothetical protein